MMLVVPADQLEAALTNLQAAGENAWHLGEIQGAAEGEELVIINE